MTEALKNYINGSSERNVYDCYTDGSCNNLSPNHEGGVAYIVLHNGEEITRRSKSLKNTTNNRAEMLAIISAVNFCPKGAKVNIYTDSRYSIFCFAERKKLKEDTKNKDLILKYREVAKGKNVCFEWIRGHNGDKYNEIVDEMANQEYLKIKEQLNQLGNGDIIF